MLSSAKVARLAFFINKNKSFMNKLNSIRPNIESCGAPETNISNRLSMLFILMFSFLLFKKEYIKARASIENPQSLILAISRSCGIYSKAFDKSIGTTPTINFLLSDDFSSPLALLGHDMNQNYSISRCKILQHFIHERSLTAV